MVPDSVVNLIWIWNIIKSMDLQFNIERDIRLGPHADVAEQKAQRVWRKVTNDRLNCCYSPSVDAQVGPSCNLNLALRLGEEPSL